jgi:GH25 family lysozyme M1 (1,4-beta-N-acetylmuramidase)
MKIFTVILVALNTARSIATVPGFDISHYQGTVNFAGAYSSGARFVIIKATEGTTYTDPNFSNNYVGATNAKCKQACLTNKPS